MRKTIIIILIQLIFLSCNQKNRDSVTEVINDVEFTQALNNSTEIVFLIQKEKQHEYAREDSAFVLTENYAAINNVQIQKFKSLFNDSEKTAYCCCPRSNYMIVFYNGKEKIDTYFADTTELKDKVIVFEKGYQSSQKIDKSLWKNFMAEVKIKR